MSQLAIVFPGQGSQTVGMLGELAEQYSVIQETFAQASSVLGYDLWSLTQTGPAEQLNQTEYTQPALLAAGVAIWRLWQQLELLQPSYFAGHSLGEYTALVCADALAFSDALQLVKKRGQLMQAAVPQGTGAMAAIVGLDDDTVASLCGQAAEESVLSPANFNSPGQVVVAGHAEAVARLLPLAIASGAKLAKQLSVSVPSHCELMLPAAEQLQTILASISLTPPQIPVVNNVDAVVTMSADDIKDALYRQLFSPVQWIKDVQHMVANDVSSVVECGPGKVLTGLNKRIDRSVNVYSCDDVNSLSIIQEMF